MKADTPQQQAQTEAHPQAKTLVLKFWGNRPRGLADVSQKYSLDLASGLKAYLNQHGYVRMMDITAGVVELYDRGKPSEAMLERYLVVAHVRNPGEPACDIVITAESLDLLLQLVRDDNLLRCPPLLPTILLRHHGISV